MGASIRVDALKKFEKTSLRTNIVREKPENIWYNGIVEERRQRLRKFPFDILSSLRKRSVLYRALFRWEKAKLHSSAKRKIGDKVLGMY